MASKPNGGVPKCGGPIDRCHIPIASSASNGTDYYNRKGWYSLLIQGVVDHSYCFIDINLGWPDSVHDARLFANSPIYKKITEENLLPCRTLAIGGVHVPIFLIGDWAYHYRHG